MALRLFIIFCLNFVIFASCKNHDQAQIAQLIKEKKKKKVIFPNNPIFITANGDTINFPIAKNQNKILIYIDSAGCTSCKLQLGQWKNFISYIDSTTDNAITFLFFIHTKNYQDLRYLLKQNSFKYPISINTRDSLNILNQFPNRILFQTFLLNEKDEIEIIGNPIHNTNLKDLYIKLIKKRYQ
ncbi:hypothetical protein [uncultured Parabacteroides sp.]|uniref:hypothetical protein n=1 Tax=uncultured Parabacteroides sp. TaxID=512312 RepID=UPI002729686F|nr:hypothetical protein [uncultured Parabacteroides sp.]